MDYLGDFADNATVNLFVTTHDGSGGAVAPSSAFEAGDFRIYKDNSATQKATTNGITISSPFDAITGLHQLTIDTSVDTGDAGFWEAGSDYTIVLSPDETVDGQAVVKAWQFSIQNRFMRGTDGANTTTPPTTTQIRDAILNYVIGGAITLEIAWRNVWSRIAGDSAVTGGSGNNPSEIEYYDPDASVDVTHSFNSTRTTRTRS